VQRDGRARTAQLIGSYLALARIEAEALRGAHDVCDRKGRNALAGEQLGVE
jgi:hypothetical protein